MCFGCRGKLGASLARAFASAAAVVAVTGGTVHAAATLDHAPYGMTQDGQAVEIYTMTNEHGLRVRFLSYGGVITEIDAPDRTGRFDNIVLGLGTLREYETLPGHFGAITGRYANRIGGAQFTLKGETYHLIANNGPNTLHGGPNALDHRVWTVSPAHAPEDGLAVTLSYVSPDGDQNFPGTLTTHVTYTLTKNDLLLIAYVASTDKDTVINFLFQPGRQRLRLGRRPAAAGECRPLHTHRTGSDPDRRDRVSRRHAARLPADDADRRPAAQRFPADGLCSRLRPQFRAEWVLRWRHDVCRASL
jgi:hypothetical protein